jgi:ribonuclease D
VELLLAAVSVISEQNALNPSIVASRKELERLVQGDQTVNVLHGWRRKLAGESLLAVLRGDAALRVVEGAVQIRGAN